MKVMLQRLGVPNQNGITYTKEAVEEAIQKRAGAPLLGTFSDEMDGTQLDLAKASHSVSNLRIEDDALVGDLQVLNTPMGLRLGFLLDGIIFKARGTGKVGDDGLVSDYSIVSINAVHKGEAA